MGSAIGNIAKKVISNVAPKVLQAVAPAATKLLKQVTDGFVSKGADFLKTTLSKLNLPNPIQSLASKLIGKGADFVKSLAGGLLDKGIAKLTELITNRLPKGVDGQVALPPIAQRLPDMAANAPTGSSSSAASGTGGAGGVTNPTGPSGASGTPDTMPKFEGDPTSIKDQNAHNEKMFKYQQAMSMMQQFWSQMSNIQKGNDDVKKGIANNFR